MRIAFVTGCLEPGRDGVGDYVRTLARECAQRGHDVALLSLAEPRPLQQNTEGKWPILRLTLAQARSDEGRAARDWVARFAPDWASLHFVPYSFHPRGFFAGRIPLLAGVTGVAPRRHIFFHELWIGSATNASPRERITGWWQRRAVARLLRQLAPQIVQTSTGYYRAALATLGQKAGVQRVFGSVPRSNTETLSAEPLVLPANALVCGMFGAVHPNWIYAPFLADFAALAAARGRPPVLAAAGALRHGAHFFARVAEEWRGRVTCMALGEHAPAALAQILARFDFAVTTSPWNLIGKSSSAAALREHGLRVVVTNGGAAPRFSVSPEEIEPEDEGFVPYFREPARLSTALTKTTPAPGVVAAADAFLQLLAPPSELPR